MTRRSSVATGTNTTGDIREACVVRPRAFTKPGRPRTVRYSLWPTVRDDVDAIDAQIEREHDALDDDAVS